MIDIRPALPDEYAAAGEVTVTAYLAEGALAPGDPYLELLRDAASRAAGAELRAAADGFDQVVISSAEWMTTAHRMYRRLGFTRVPERDWWPRPDVHLLAYVHPLG